VVAVQKHHVSNVIETEHSVVQEEEEDSQPGINFLEWNCVAPESGLTIVKWNDDESSAVGQQSSAAVGRVCLQERRSELTTNNAWLTLMMGVLQFLVNPSRRYSSSYECRETVSRQRSDSLKTTIESFASSNVSSRAS